MILFSKKFLNQAAVLLLCTVLGGMSAVAQSAEAKETSKPSKAEVMSLLVSPAIDHVAQVASEKKIAPHLVEPKKASADTVTEEGEEKQALNIPIPVGHKVKGIKIPYFDLQGVKQMEFYATVANRLDDDRIELDEVRMETFTPEGESDMVINLPKSVFFVATQNIVSDTEVLIERSDFKIVGETMDFDTRTRKGKLIGRVKMTIYKKEGGVLAPKKPATE